MVITWHLVTIIISVISCGVQGRPSIGNQELRIEDPPPHAPPCSQLTKAHLTQFALNNTLLVTVVDRLVMQTFGKSWVENVKSAGISYWMVAALDPWTSKLLGHWGVKSCFNAPLERLRYKGSGEHEVKH